MGVSVESAQPAEESAAAVFVTVISAAVRVAVVALSMISVRRAVAMLMALFCKLRLVGLRMSVVRNRERYGELVRLGNLGVGFEVIGFTPKAKKLFRTVWS